MVEAGHNADHLMVAGRNILGMPGYEQLKKATQSGNLGRMQ
jgi:hypothetical protein